MDYQALLYDPVYSVLGVEATLTLPGTDGAVIDLTALDKTAGIEVGGLVARQNRDYGTSADVLTVKPAAIVRRSELADIDLDDLDDATLTMNGKNWRVIAHMPKPSPKGEADGEELLILMEAS